MISKKLARKVLSFVFPLLCVILFGMVLGDYFYYRQRFLPGYYLEKFPLGDLTRKEAFTFLTTQDIEKKYLFPRAFIHKNKEHSFLPSQISLAPLIRDSVKKAFENSYAKSYVASLLFRWNAAKVIFPLYFKVVDKSELGKFLGKVDRQVKNTYHHPTFVVGKDGKIFIKPEKPRRTLDIPATISGFEKNLSLGKTLTPLILCEKKALRKPSFGISDLKRIPHPALLGSYTTYYGTHNAANRVRNIILGAKLVNDILLSPRKTFSLLKRMGEFSRKRGFRPASVIVGEGLTLEYGGGACQIATTLYNAAALADLDILSRTNHAIYFNIYPLGRDAALYSPNMDLKFRNNTGAPILITSKTTKKGLTFQIFGRATGKKVSFTSAKVTYKGKAFRTLVTRTVYRYGRVIKRENLSSSYKLDGDKKRIGSRL